MIGDLNILYVGIGAAPDTGYYGRVGHFWCIDVTKKGDVSPAPGNFDPKSPANKNSALVWHFGGEIMPRPPRGRTINFGKTMSSAAVHDDRVHPHVLQEHDVAREVLLQRVVDHRRAAVLDHHRLPVELADVRQRLEKCFDVAHQLV